MWDALLGCICQNWQIEIVDVTLEAALWVKFQHQKSGHVFFGAVCYVPPVGSSREVDVAEHLLFLEEQTQKFQARNRWFSVVTLMLGVVG